MGLKYDGCLICSDIDGTLTDGQGFISKENAEAIRRFQQGGGLFTVATGRYADFVKKFAPEVVPNTYVVALNGAVVTDVVTGEEKWFADLPRDSLDEIIKIYDKCPQMETIYLNMQLGCLEFTRENIVEAVQTGVTDGNKLYKIVFTSPQAITKETRQILFENSNGRYLCEQSWEFGIEYYGPGAGKRSAVEQLKRMTGAKKLVCIGDYENDISMIEYADLGVAVANAKEEVKKAADFVTVSNNESAIARVIDKL